MLTVLLGQPLKQDQERPKVIKAHARVVSSRKSPSGSGFHLGLSFVRQPGDELSILADLIQEMESTQTMLQEQVIEASNPITTNSRLARLKELAQSRLLEEKKDNSDEGNNRISEALERAFGYLK